MGKAIFCHFRHLNVVLEKDKFPPKALKYSILNIYIEDNAKLTFNRSFFENSEFNQVEIIATGTKNTTVYFKEFVIENSKAKSMEISLRNVEKVFFHKNSLYSKTNERLLVKLDSDDSVDAFLHTEAFGKSSQRLSLNDVTFFSKPKSYYQIRMTSGTILSFEQSIREFTIEISNFLIKNEIDINDQNLSLSLHDSEISSFGK